MTSKLEKVKLLVHHVTGRLYKIRSRLAETVRFIMAAANVSRPSRNVRTSKTRCQLVKKCCLIARLALLNLPHAQGQVRLPKRDISEQNIIILSLQLRVDGRHT